MTSRLKEKLHFLQKRSFWIFFALSIYYIASRLWPLVRFGDAAFGYDLGIYRRIVLDYLSGQPQPPFAFGYLARFLHTLGLSPDGILYGFYVAAVIVLGGLLVWHVHRNAGTKAALIAACLMNVSLVQFSFYQWYYFRNLLAVVLFLCTTFLLKKKSYLTLLPLFALISIHPLTAIPVLLSLGIYAAIQKAERTFILTHVVLSASLALLCHWAEFGRYIDIAFQFSGRVGGAAPAEFDGQFISFRDFIIHTMLYLPFGLIGVWKYRKKYVLWSSLFFVSTTLVIVRVLLYKRFFFLMDMCLIFFASMYLSELYKKIQLLKWRYAVVSMYIACLFWVSIPYVLYAPSAIPTQTLEEIRALRDRIPPQSTILSFESKTAPWLLGFAGDHTIVAPGVFDANKWSRVQWEMFWSTQDIAQRRELLSVYDADTIYIFSTAYDAPSFFADDPHIQRLTDALWVYSFES